MARGSRASTYSTWKQNEQTVTCSNIILDITTPRYAHTTHVNNWICNLICHFWVTGNPPHPRTGNPQGQLFSAHSNHLPSSSNWRTRSPSTSPAISLLPTLTSQKKTILLFRQKRDCKQKKTQEKPILYVCYDQLQSEFLTTLVRST